ncbi:MAG: helix-turn-helix domain-containing protein [Faecousia sp.]
MNAKRIGLRIQDVRLQRGLTQAGLAQKLDITPKYLSNIECGDKIPKFETFIAIANALQIDANTLLADELVAMPQVQSSLLWDRISKLPPNRQKHILRMVDILLEEEN